MIRMFALFAFVYVLVESFVSCRLMVVDYFYSRTPEYTLRNYVFGHSYQSEVYFSVKS